MISRKPIKVFVFIRASRNTKKLGNTWEISYLYQHAPLSEDKFINALNACDTGERGNQLKYMWTKTGKSSALKVKGRIGVSTYWMTLSYDRLQRNIKIYLKILPKNFFSCPKFSFVL